MKKEVSIVMLPTEKAKLEKGCLLLRHIWKYNPRLECRSIWQYKAHDKIKFGVEVITTLNGSFADVPSSFVPQNLYFLSEDEIKIGDWYLTDNNKILQANKIISLGFVYAHGDYGRQLRHCKKIIATTDEALNLPRPSNEFLKKYCEGGGIEKVLVEYEADYQYTNNQMVGIKDKLKIAQDNTITIYQIK